MKGSLLVARKDLTILFRSPLAYLLLASFMLLCGVFFVARRESFELISMQLMQNPNIQGVTISDMLVVPYLNDASVIFLFMLPLLTMRGFAEEKRMGTFEMLMSYPVSEAGIVAGKLLALAGFLLATLAMNAVNPMLLYAFSEPELAPMLVGYLGLFLLGTAFASLGLFLSTLTENQIISAALSFSMLLIFWVLHWVKDLAPAAVSPVVGAMSLVSHFAPFTKGVLELGDAVYYLTFIAAFFWLSVLSLENQRWRG